MFSALNHPTADLERTVEAMKAEKTSSLQLAKAPQWAKDQHAAAIKQIEAELQNRHDALDKAVRQNSAGGIVRALRTGR